MADDVSLAARTAAILVIYQLERPLGGVLSALAPVAGVTIVVDNSENGHAALPGLTALHGATLLKAGNRGGLAGAYNQALTYLRHKHPSTVDFVVFVDDDSDPTVLGPLLSDPAAKARLASGDTAALAPAYRDRATGLRGKYIVLRRFSLTYLSRHFQDLRAVAFVINSMSVWRVDALQRIGAFNEALAIDHVDTEYCLRARALGLSVYVHGGHEFAHSIGQRRRFRFLGRDMQAGGHSPARRYLIGRNTTWLARRWLWREPAFAFLCVSRLAYEIVGILVAEDHAAAKLKALLRGIAAGVLKLRAA